ncbi:MAG: TspO protein [Brevundimonas sp.]|jgi:hypothetical protein|uniref:TspO protein n=1 Tax=Brevundimonas sp. TaxID=1871086 RepID=UPI00391B6D11
MNDLPARIESKAQSFLNSEGRSARHVAMGLALATAVSVGITALSQRLAKSPSREDRHSPVEAPRNPLSLMAPAIFSASTLAALRVWNGPTRPAKHRALGLWMGLQLANALTVARRPSRLVTQVGAAAATAGLAAAFAHQARRLDRRTGAMASTEGGKVSLVNRIGHRLGINRERPTLH